MGRVGPLSSASFQPSSLPTPLQKEIQQALFRFALDQASTKLGKNGMIKANVIEVQAEGILPGQSIADSVSSLAISQPFHKLKDGHQRQPPRSESGLTMSREQVGKCLIRVNGSQRVAYLHEYISTGKDRMSNTNNFFWNRRNRQRFE